MLEDREISVLRFLAKDDNELERFHSLTTLFEQMSRPSEWRNSFFDQLGPTDSKEALQIMLEQMVLDDLLEARMDDRGYERSYRATDHGIYEATVGSTFVVDNGGRSIGFARPAAPTDHLHPSEPSEPYDSGRWTGLPSGFVISRNSQSELIALLNTAEQNLDSVGASNSEKAMARAYIVAARTLAEAPEPPADLIWELVNRANSLAGIASLFVSIIALFMATQK